MDMNAAAKKSSQLIEKTLNSSTAFKKIDEGLFVVKQGSSIVMINVLPWKDRAVVRCVAQLVKGVTMEVPLALQLLEMNAQMRFGAFAYVPAGDVIIFSHTLLGGATLDAEELVTTIRDVAIVADEYDDRIAARYGGSTMQDLLEDSVIEHFRTDHDKKEHFKS
jgi:Putative bacterial sensory transduction regulator